MNFYFSQSVIFKLSFVLMLKLFQTWPTEAFYTDSYILFTVFIILWVFIYFLIQNNVSRPVYIFDVFVPELIITLKNSGIISAEWYLDTKIWNLFVLFVTWDHCF